jgi:alpha-tubulin suppressor-like RCC1 family protein
MACAGAQSVNSKRELIKHRKVKDCLYFHRFSWRTSSPLLFMNTFSLGISLLILAVTLAQAQTSSVAAGESGAATVATNSAAATFHVVERGANYRVWQREVSERAPDGKLVSRIHKYTELGTGMYHQDASGQWVESSETIKILPDGTAAATNGQHQAYFPVDIYTGAIKVVTRDGQQVQSRPALLCYVDGTNSVILARLKHSVGELAGTNQVIYPDAFEGLAATLRYTYTRAGFEQDIVLFEQPAPPETFGLDPRNTKLELMTEFSSSAEPSVEAALYRSRSGLIDHDLRFGEMKMLPGKAFLTKSRPTSPVEGIPVYKNWLRMQGRSFLVETLPFDTLKPQLTNLPPTASLDLGRTNSELCKVSGNLQLPAARPFSAGTNQLRMARVEANEKAGLVLDYLMLGSEVTNFTFRGDTTYFLPAGTFFWVDGTCTIEGGTVVKMAPYDGSFIDSVLEDFGTVICDTAPFRPAVFTAQDDASVGEAIPGSTGSPSGYYGEAIEFFSNDALWLHDIRLSYLEFGLDCYTASLQLDNLQAVDCYYPVIWGWGTATINNSLFYNVAGQVVGNSGGAPAVVGTHVTAHNCNAFASGPQLTLSNSLLVDVTNLVASGGTLTTNDTVILADDTGVFQTVGAGSHYLATGSPYRNSGTTNIDPDVLAEIQARTTYPPIVYSNTTISTATTFGPQAERDNVGNPDLGFHYPVLDYVFGASIAQSNLTYTAGTVAGYFFNSAGETYALALADGVTAAFNGIATNPCRWVEYSTVQEGNGNWTAQSSLGGLTGLSYTQAAPAIQASFTLFNGLADDGLFFGDEGTLLRVQAKNSEFYSGGLGGYCSSLNLTNCLFFNSAITLLWNYGAANLALENCTFFGGSVSAANQSGGIWPLNIVNCAFDQTTFDLSAYGGQTNGYYADFNSFLANSNTTPYLGGHEVFVTNSYNWQTSWLGGFYLPPDSLLIDAGSTTADQVGLYQFTTQTNQVKETNSIVDIGYHYVAVSTNGTPVDSNGNGLPDYLEDTNGNGSGPWMPVPVITVQPASQTVSAGANVTFSVTATSLVPPAYQWYLNGTNVLAGATNATLLLSGVQVTDAGVYSVAVCDPAGCATSADAVLIVEVPLEITVQPASQTVVQGNTAIFNVAAIGASPLSYQWYFNRTNALAGATNFTFKVTNVQPTNAGEYSVVVGNAEDTVCSSNAVLTIQLPANPALAVGGERIVELTAGGDVISWGGNQFGELGDYTHLDSTNPVHIVGLTDVTNIAAGPNHSLAVDANGVLWAWGDNQYGQLGDGTLNATNVPVRVSPMSKATEFTVTVSSNVIAVAGNEQTSIAATSDGKVWTWGTTEQGTGSSLITIVATNPTQIAGLSHAVAVGAGKQYFLVVLSDGSLRAWGNDDSGQLGNGMLGESSDTPVQVVGLSNIVAICVGDSHSLALDAQGRVWAWGLNDHGQLGDGGAESASALPLLVFSNAVQIAAGSAHSLATDTQGKLWSWGNDSVSQLGDASSSNVNLPAQVLSVSNVVAIGAGSDASAALDIAGKVWQWGSSDSDQGSWVWNGTNGYPEMAPTYVDFYRGQLPILSIVTGNNQVIRANDEFTQPLVFQVNAPNGNLLTNAPVSVEVVSGELDLRMNHGGVNLQGARLTTDTNGEVSLVGFADGTLANTNYVVRALAASREKVTEADFLETFAMAPTVAIINPQDGATYLVGTNQPLVINVDAGVTAPLTIQTVDFSCGTNGVADTPLGYSSVAPFTFTWTNASWWSNDFVGQYTLAAVALDSMGVLSTTQSASITVALDTYWGGLPDYLMDTNGTLGAWQMKYFGHLGIDPNGDYDGDGVDNLQEYLNGTDPNKISFSFALSNQYVSSNIVTGTVLVLGGVPSYFAVFVDNTNFAAANWMPYTSSDLTVNLGPAQGPHDVWIGLRGLPVDAHQTWVGTTIVLDSAITAITITSPEDGVELNSSRVNIGGNFCSGELKGVAVNGVQAFVNGTNFEALNVPLAAGNNAITAVVENTTGLTNSASINIVGLVNADGSMNSPVRLQASPVAGFAPLAVTFTAQGNAPGNLQLVEYDFNGDDIADYAASNIEVVTHVYATNGQYYPLITLQTSMGRFSSVGGWNADIVDTNLPVCINVKSNATVTSFANISDPVDIKWNGTNLYALSGSAATLTEFNADGSISASLANLGNNPTGFAVDASGNVYVVVTSSNQIWKFNMANGSFAVDTNFGFGGFIGNTNAQGSASPAQFNVPYMVIASPDGTSIFVSDFGNDRIEQFSAINGAFVESFGSSGAAVGQFHGPKGMAFDPTGLLYVADSGNGRIVLFDGDVAQGANGTTGTDVDQFINPVGLCTGRFGVYVADAGNNRIQNFRFPGNGNYNFAASDIRFILSTNFSNPCAVAADDSATNDVFYVADTGNNRILLCTVPNPATSAILAVWNTMVNDVNSGDFAGAASCFSTASSDDYLQEFLSIGSANITSAIDEIGDLTPAELGDDTALFYFTQVIAGQSLIFPVRFINEYGIWKILEF